MAASRVMGAATAKRQLLTRAAVLAAARDMVAESGYEALSLRPLAARLHVTAAALYMFTDDRRGLLEAVAEAEYEGQLRKYRAIRATDPIERLREIARIYVADARNEPELFRLRLRFSPFIGEDSAEAASAAGREAFELAKSAVEDAMVEGVIREGDPFALSMMIWAAVHGVAAFVLMGVERRPEIDHTLVDQVVEAMIAGLSPHQPDTPGADAGNTLTGPIPRRHP